MVFEGLAAPHSCELVENLRDSVEAYCNREIIVASIQGGPGLPLAFAEISDDGTPWVQVATGLSLTTDLLAHELFHLEFKRRGFAEYEIQPQSEHWMEDLLFWIRRYIRDPIQHAMFFPDMRTNSLDPTSGFGHVIQNNIQSNFVPFSISPDVEGAAYLFKLLMEEAPVDALNDLEHYYIDKGWIGAVSLAHDCLEIASHPLADTPDAEIINVHKCMRVLLNGLAIPTITALAPATRGSHVQRRVVIGTEHEHGPNASNGTSVADQIGAWVTATIENGTTIIREG